MVAYGLGYISALYFLSEFLIFFKLSQKSSARAPQVLNKWKQIDMKITDQANEAADNARYLRSLEPACKPLYAYDPISMIEHIPNLIKVISNIYQGTKSFKLP